MHPLADRAQAQARLAQRVRPISFLLGQVTSGHGQLHLQVEELRHVTWSTTLRLGVAFQS